MFRHTQKSYAQAHTRGGGAGVGWEEYQCPDLVFFKNVTLKEHQPTGARQTVDFIKQLRNATWQITIPKSPGNDFVEVFPNN